ncbi:saccharopine dehydrogenase family protein [Roseimaritima ulvae]|uniref:Lysine 6-dehydrogenase n=1 Tax=Roseimaritima ulvae TaxID=980254 RepID=A0A5B9QV00_9BACT|nr:saccharopine dehydrogenase C-terminal domain-containing protein [Roseimaritima ulvae]QEG41782.1 Lysine 6-dehydrogenase [Roseimaritima ulvae]
MHRVLLLGAGKIGRMIVQLLSETEDYRVTVADAQPMLLERFADSANVSRLVLDASDDRAVRTVARQHDSLISALSFRFNPLLARLAVEAGVNYFDLTEDTQTTLRVRQAAEHAQPQRVVMPQCGLAPGFISIVAQHLATDFDTLETVKMRVGALPQFPTNALKYNLTWSTDGLINEYCNPCDAIHQGQRVEVLPLEGLEHFSLDGVRYEAFHTSGGLGTLCDTLQGRVNELNYKTIRYQGHRDLASFLINDLKLNRRRGLLKEILEDAIPVTFQDVVVVFCSVTGQRHGQLVQVNDARKIYSRSIDEEPWSAIQVTTASSVCAALDLWVAGDLTGEGFMRQEQIPLDKFLANRFGRAFHCDAGTRYSSAFNI